MGENAGFEQPVVQDVNTPAPTEPAAPPADNPAWSPFLEGIPEGLHGLLKDRLRKQDSQVDERFRTVHSEYEPYKWAKEGKIDGTELQNAYGFFQTANDNPRAVYDFLGEQFGFNNPQQGQQVNSPSQDDGVDLSEYDDAGSAFDIENHPTVKQLREQQARFEQQFEQIQQQSAQVEANKWVEAVSDRLSKEFPDIDADRVWAQANGMFAANQNIDLDKVIFEVAANEQKYIDSIRSRPAPGALAPQVLSPTGGSPVAPNPSQMSAKDQHNAAVAFLTAARDADR